MLVIIRAIYLIKKTIT